MIYRRAMAATGLKALDGSSHRTGQLGVNNSDNVALVNNGAAPARLFKYKAGVLHRSYDATTWPVLSAGLCHGETHCEYWILSV
jgi:hypothetical protein